MSTDEPDTRKRGRSEEGSCRGSEDIVQNENSDSSQGKEILLCLRPIRNGDEKPDESLRFKPMRHNDKRMVSEENSGEECDVSPVDGFSTEMPCASPSSKNDKDKSQPRRLSKKHVSTPSKRNNRSAEEDVDHAVVESLMSMSSQKEK